MLDAASDLSVVTSANPACQALRQVIARVEVRSRERLGAFANRDGIYNPVRPPGLGELPPGMSVDEVYWPGCRLGERYSQAGSNLDGSVIYRYAGKLNDATLMHLHRDTIFTGEEVVLHDGTISETHIRYSEPITIKFFDKRGEARAILNVQAVDVIKEPSGFYLSQVKTSTRIVIFRVGSDGRVL